MKKLSQLLLLALFAVLVLNSCNDKKEETARLLIKIDSSEVQSKQAVFLGDTFYVEINSNVTWTSTVSSTWCTISLSRGVNSQIMKVSIPENPTPAERSAVITFTDGDITKTLTITQIGEYKLNVSDTTLRDVASQAGDTLTIDSNTDWTISSDQSWCTLSDSLGNGDKRIFLTFEDNLTEADRQATLTLVGGGKTRQIAVTQSGGAILLNETFDNNLLGWDVNEYVITSDSTIKIIQDGYYNMENAYPRDTFSLSSNLVLPTITSNYILECGIKYISGTKFYGITFGQGSTGLYTFLINNSTNYCHGRHRYNATWQSNLFSKTTSAISSDYNTLKVIRIGTSYKFYINGTFIYESKILTAYGLYMGLFIRPSKIKVDYFKVRSLSE